MNKIVRIISFNIIVELFNTIIIFYLMMIIIYGVVPIIIVNHCI